MSTTAAAPSDDGHDSRKRIGSHSIGDSLTFSIVMSGSFRCAYGFFNALSRSFTATFHPMYSGAPGLRDVGAHPRCECAAGADAAALAAGQTPLRVAFGLLLPREGKHPLVDARIRSGARRR